MTSHYVIRKTASILLSVLIFLSGLTICIQTSFAEPSDSASSKAAALSYMITGDVNNSDYGYVTGSGTYLAGTSVTLSAYPNPGYQFVRWVGSGSRSAKVSIVVSEDRTLTAEFAPIEAPSTFSADPYSSDSIRLEWGMVNGAKGYEIFRSTRKNGTYSKIASTTSVSYIDADLPVRTYYYKVRAYCTCRTAITYSSFTYSESAAALSYMITGDVNNSDYGYVTGSGRYPGGTSITLSAYPNPGYQFVRWVGSGSRSAKVSIVVSEDRTLTAEFALIETPTGITAVSSGLDRIQVSWNAVDGANGYEIFRSTTKNGTYSKVGTVTSGSILTYNQTGLSCRTYYYKVRAYCTCRTAVTYSSLSVSASSTPSADAPLSEAAADGYYGIRVLWSPVIGASGYEIYRSTTKSGTYSRVYIASSATASYLNTGLTGDKVYYYKVRAYRTSGCTTVYTVFSGIVSAKTLFPIGSASVSFSGPTAVVGGQTIVYNYTLNVTGASAANANIAVGGAFEKVSGGTNLFYDTIPNNTNGSVSGSVTVRVKQDALPGEQGTLSVVADESSCVTLIYSSNGGIYGNPYIVPITGSIFVTVTDPPAVPTGVIAESAGSDRIKVSWNTVPDANGYQVYCSTKKSGVYSLVYTASSGSVNSFLHTGRVTSKTYYYKVRAYSIINGVKVFGNYAAIASAFPIQAISTYNNMGIDAPSSIVSWKYSSTSIKLVWSPVTNAYGYEVFRSVSTDSGFTRQKATASTYYINTGLTTGTRYYYKVRAYSIIDGVKIFGNYTTITSAIP